jgi:hypothetical protein
VLAVSVAGFADQEANLYTQKIMPWPGAYVSPVSSMWSRTRSRSASRLPPGLMPRARHCILRSFSNNACTQARAQVSVAESGGAAQSLLLGNPPAACRRSAAASSWWTATAAKQVGRVGSCADAATLDLQAAGLTGGSRIRLQSDLKCSAGRQGEQDNARPSCQRAQSGSTTRGSMCCIHE